MDWLTVEDIKKLKPKMIFYGALTPWWTHDPAHLSKTPKGTLKILNPNTGGEKEVETGGLPADPLGCVLFQTEDVDGFLNNAIANTQHYGKHGIRAFEATHHSNAKALNIIKCFEDWRSYNAWLDKVDELGGQAPTDHLRCG